MRDKISITLAIIALIGSGALWGYQLQTQRTELAYVDTNQLLNGYQGMVQARKAYEKKEKEWQANLDTLTAEVKAAIMDHEKNLAKMTAKEQELSKKLIRTKQQQLQQYQQAIRQKAQQEDQAMTQKVLEEVNAYLKAYGEKHHYRIILATGNGNIAYAEEALDITEAVLEGLNGGKR